MELLTSYQGKNHLTSQQFRSIIESITGTESYIGNVGEFLECELAANNTLKIRSGILIHHGGVMQVNPGTYDEVTYQNGNQAMKRIDLVVARYIKEANTGIESSEWVVIQGTPDESSPVTPAYTEGSMQNGDLVDDCPVFELHFDGINVTEVKKLVPVVQSNSELKYKPGDTEICTFWGGAMFTGGNKNIVFTITTTKDMSDISNISVTSPETNIRQSGNYLAGSASSNITSGFSVSCEKVNSKTLKINVVFASSVGGTNNDAVGLMFKGTLNFA